MEKIYKEMFFWARPAQNGEEINGAILSENDFIVQMNDEELSVSVLSKKEFEEKYEKTVPEFVLEIGGQPTWYGYFPKNINDLINKLILKN